MKQILIVLAFVLLNSCTSEETPDPLAGLPPETQIGANTFGCLIDGKLYKPRCEKPSLVFPQWGLVVFGSYDNSYNEIIAKDLKSSKYFEILIHVKKNLQNIESSYIIDESNGFSGIDGLNQTYINCIIFDFDENIYKKYISFDNSGILNVTKKSPVETQEFIYAGNFQCKLININNPSDTINVTYGRFDINQITVMYHEFP